MCVSTGITSCRSKPNSKMQSASFRPTPGSETNSARTSGTARRRNPSKYASPPRASSSAAARQIVAARYPNPHSLSRASPTQATCESEGNRLKSVPENKGPSSESFPTIAPIRFKWLFEAHKNETRVSTAELGRINRKPR